MGTVKKTVCTETKKDKSSKKWKQSIFKNIFKKDGKKSDKACHEEESEVCSPVLRNVCWDEPKQVCKDVEKQVCTPGAEICKEVSKKVPKKNCGIKKKQKCIPVPEKSCENISVEKCE